MRRCAIMLPVLLISIAAPAQEMTEVTEQQLENLAEINETETEDDSYWQQLDYYKKHPVNLNTASAVQLEELRLLTPLQISNFLRYRDLLGNLVNIYEIQAVPGWDITTIKKLLPFITVADEWEPARNFGKRFTGGEASMLFRIASLLETPVGYRRKETGLSHYTGSKDRLLFRCRYNYKDLLQYGISGKKDAGEQFFRGKQQYGFDFYSIHFFARKLGIVKALALGDYVVNMGQGLIQWQSLAFGKSTLITDVKRQGAVLKPHTSAGEFNFHRGAGVTIGKRNWEVTVFGSLRVFSATLAPDSTEEKGLYVATLLTSGYHRTPSELARRNNLHSFSAGGNFRVKGTNWRAGFNMVQYQFEYPMRASANWYDRFAISGKRWGNYSVDYSYTFSNVHMFGEIATDYKYHQAFAAGLITSPDPRVDVTMVYRNIDKAYQSLFSNAFTENSMPTNESGLYTGLVIRPFAYWQVNAYADFFSFPWLKYRVNAPFNGYDYMVQLTCTPSKRVEIYSRYRYRSKPLNSDDALQPMRNVTATAWQSWRTQLALTINTRWQLRHRVDLVRFQSATDNVQNGFAAYVDCSYNAPLLSAGIRLHYFDTDGYDSRIYAFEQSVAYSYPVVILYNKGFRYYANTRINISSVIRRYIGREYNGIVTVRMAQFLYNSQTQIGSGLDAITGNSKTDYIIQLLLTRR